MHQAWIGERLTGASEAIAGRLAETATQGPGTLLPLAEELVAEIGRALTAGERSARVPFARTFGVLRLARQTPTAAIVAEFQTLARLVREYLSNLPGYDQAIDRYARDCLQHAARVTVDLQRRLDAGLPHPAPGASFGGVVVAGRPAVAAGA